MEEVQESDTSIQVTSDAVRQPGTPNRWFCLPTEVHAGGTKLLKANDICFQHGCLPSLHVLFLYIELELSPQAEPTPRLYSSNTSTDKYCQPQTHRASLTHTHIDLRGSINKPPTALFQSLNIDIAGPSECVLCYCSPKQTRQSIRPLAILHYSPWNARLYKPQHGLSVCTKESILSDVGKRRESLCFVKGFDRSLEGASPSV